MLASVPAPSASTGQRTGSSTAGGWPNRFLPQYGPRLVDAVLVALQEATESAELEAYAVSKIQATYRMHRCRTAFLRTRRSIVQMQSLYRGHAQRQQTMRLRAVAERQRLRAVFDVYATAIQACFRGFYSRKYKDDFYARKRYLCEVTNRGQQVLALSSEVNAELDTLVRLRADTAEHAAYTEATERSHYMLSTAVRAGVFQPPLILVSGPAEGTMTEDEVAPSVKGTTAETMATVAVGGVTTHFGTRVEEDIRANAAQARSAALEQRFRTNASTRFPTGATATVTPAVTLGDGCGTGLAAVSGALSVNGCTDDVVRRHRHARRARYAESVRACHYPSHTTQPAPVGSNSVDFAASAPARSGGDVGLGAEAGFLPPIRPSKVPGQASRRAKHTTPLSASAEPSSKAPPGGLPGEGSTAWAANAATSAPVVPWVNADSLPAPSPPLASSFSSARANAGKKSTINSNNNGRSLGGAGNAQRTLAVSSHDKRFHVPSHDCGAHMALNAPAAGPGREAEKPLYDTASASLKRSVDAKVQAGLHGKATFKV